MKRLGSWLFALNLLTACEKEVPFEHTKPAGAAMLPGPSLDASSSLDASLGAADGAVGARGAIEEIPVEFTKAGLLEAIGDCALARYRAFEPLAQDVRAVTATWAERPSDDTRAAAQRAFRAAMASWQELELFAFGPAGSASEAGGRDLRDPIYVYPFINYCLVDQQLVNQAYVSRPLAIDDSAKGLGALEYLLFHPGPENSCSAAVTINAQGTWAQIEAAELTRRRGAYAAAIGEDLAAQSAALRAAWEPGEGNFYAQLAQAGQGSPLFTSDQAAFNAVADALFYLDKIVKDAKVAVPVGISPDCPSELCPQAVESRFAQLAGANIRANLSGFRAIFQGCGRGYTGLGFDDWLSAVGNGDLSDRMSSAIAGAERAVDALTLPLEALLTADPAQVIALHGALKAITDLLKTEFLSALNLELPTSAQGDND